MDDKTNDSKQNIAVTEFKGLENEYPSLLGIGLIPILCIIPPLILFARIVDFHLQISVIGVFLLSICAYIATSRIIPQLASNLVQAGIKGRDLNKESPIIIPEAMGVVSGTAFLISLIFCELIYPASTSKIIELNAAIGAICFMLLLGFVDDVLELNWNVKLIMPAIAALPLVVTYSGPTWVAFPNFFNNWTPISFNLGYLFHFYMISLVVFCTNAINIHAGLNGLEVGQSVVIGSSLLIHHILEISTSYMQENSLFSIVVITPFLSVSLALLKFNWYPAQVFVGDTYTYFAGMTFAVIGILGHCSKTLLLFFLPQVFNFMYSFPQLLNGRIFGIYCPRHRLPRFNQETKKLESIHSHRNLINLVLRFTGPLNEATLCNILLTLQIITCAIGIYLRHTLYHFFPRLYNLL